MEQEKTEKLPKFGFFTYYHPQKTKILQNYSVVLDLSISMKKILQRNKQNSLDTAKLTIFG